MRFVMAVLGLTLAGCSTPYGPSGLLGGFEETQLAPNAWRVSFTGNGFTTQEQTQDFVLLRSAELALKNRYSYFGFASESVRTTPGGVIGGPSTSATTGSAYVSGNAIYGNANTTTYPGGAYAFGFPTANSTVVMFREKPATQGMIYDAQFICSSLGAKHKTSCRVG